MGWLARLMSIPGLVRGLDEQDLDPDPVRQFGSWYRFARRARIYWPNSAALATASAEGRPSVRMILLKRHGPDGFDFYTNYESRKGRELDANPFAEMVIYWNDLLRQVRIRGPVERLSREDSAAYFHSRPRGSQIGAWVSRQDTPVENRAALMSAYDAYEKEFKGREVPLPAYWGGYRIRPEALEFWQGRTYRLHDRFLYTKSGDGGWNLERLSP